MSLYKGLSREYILTKPAKKIKDKGLMNTRKYLKLLLNKVGAKNAR